MIVIVQTWEESERGWGCRPDGISIHKTMQDRDTFCNKYWEREVARNGKTIPDEYSRENGKPFVAELLDDNTISALLKSEYGIRLWQWDYRELKKANGIKIC